MPRVSMRTQETNCQKGTPKAHKKAPTNSQWERNIFNFFTPEEADPHSAASPPRPQNGSEERLAQAIKLTR
jgi:hypothetical protein